jgi:phospholipid/cholesterol/gamma-HCH transport system permease protein
MSQSAAFEVSRSAGASGGAVVALVGDWTAQALGRTGERFLRQAPTGARLDVSRLGRFDTVGAFILIRAGVSLGGLDARPDIGRLVALVGKPAPEAARGQAKPRSAYAMLVRSGKNIENIGSDAYQTLAFIGRLASTLARIMVLPQRLRVAPTVALMERAGLDALPIVATTNFFIGATVGFLGANLLAQFGASVFTVELIGVASLREFGVLITAVLLAGRSASSFAAELGAMKMNQEVDAMQVLGVDPFEALVVPRFIALLTMTPLLTFVAMIASIAGGMLVTWWVLDLSPAFFLERLLANVSPTNFWLGMVKAPFLAVVIAAIGCRQGLEVGGDVEQLGRRVTIAVVQAIFSIIVIDAVFALIFMELNV